MSAAASDEESTAEVYGQDIWNATYDKPTDGPISRRLAITGLDWKNIDAGTIYELSRSAVTPEDIRHVCIYYSDIGEAHKEEESEGPKWMKNISDPSVYDLVSQYAGDGENDDRDDDSYHLQRYRKYLYDRSFYRFAIITCTSKSAAQRIYNFLDGMDIDMCVIGAVDVRYVNKSLSFKGREVLSKADKPPIHFNMPMRCKSSLKHTTKMCDFDESDDEKIQLSKHKFTEADFDNPLYTKYIADDESDVDFDSYKTLVNEIDKIKSSGIEELGQDSAGVLSEDDFGVEELVEHKKRAKKTKMKKTKTESDPNDAVKQKKKKLKSIVGLKEDSNDEKNLVDTVLSDRRYERLLSNPDYAIDPTHPSYKPNTINKGFLQRVRQKKLSG